MKQQDEKWTFILLKTRVEEAEASVVLTNKMVIRKGD